MTIEQAFDVLEAAGRLAEVYGLELVALTKPTALCLELWRGEGKYCSVEIGASVINACKTSGEVVDLVERELAATLVQRAGRAAS